MLIAILILTIFNTGLTIITGLSVVGIIKMEMIAAISAGVKHTDQSIEAATTALYNMDSIKQKVEMTGEFEL